MKKWAITNASRIMAMDLQGSGQPLRRGKKPDILDGHIIIGNGNKIERVTNDPSALRGIDNIIDAAGRLVTPGLIDSHTHTIFYGTREREYALRIAGASYNEIAAAGGGILNTARRVREASQEQLVEHAIPYLHSFIKRGTTTIETKSGYGLSTESELKMLRAARDLKGKDIIDIVSTFLGAHEVPEEYRPKGKLGDKNDFINLVKEEMIPTIAKEKLAKYCDVFCEEGVFTPEETRDILEKGKTHGLMPRFHADEIVSTGGAELAAEIGAKSADHLGAISDKGIDALADSDTVATLLPGTVLFLNLSTFAPARALIDKGAIVALASDFNPGSCPTNNLQLIMTLAASRMRMTIPECWAAVTVNAAYSLDMADCKGAISAGYDADIVIWETDSEDKVPYHFGMDLVNTVIRGGKVAYRA